VDRSDRLFLLLVLIGLAAALFLAVGRARVERSNRIVEMVVDADDVRQLAMAAGLPTSAVLEQLRRAGATALAVRELTIGELVDLGSVMPMALPGGTTLVSPDPELLSVLAGAIHAKLPRAEVGLLESRGGVAIVLRGLDMDQLMKVPVLLRTEDVRAARGAGLRLVARLMNFAAASPEAISAAAAEAKAAGATLVIFREDQVLGFQDLLTDTAEAFDRNRLLYGYIEMVSQKGGDALAARLIPRLVRVHSITEADMQTISPAVAIPRYARAVEERNVRACYLRLILRPQPDPMGKNSRYLEAIATALRGRGFRVGPPAPFFAPEGWPPKWARELALLALPAALVLLLRRLLPLSQGWAWLIFVLVMAAGLLLHLGRPALAVPVSGLAAACVFPALALAWVMQWARGLQVHVTTGRLIGRALLGLLLGCLVTLAGSMVIVGLFSRVGYLEGVGRFLGVKLAYLAPVLVILAVVLFDLPGRVEPGRQWWMRVRLRAGQFFRQPVSMIAAAVILIALAALAFAISRSGNQPAVAPTGGELKLRGLLESLLAVRPRTKEFLLGHPALMLAVALSLRGRRTWLPLIAILAGVGQVSLLNTFCHFHTPLYVSLIRTANGIWLGALVGVVVVLVWRRLCDHGPRPTRS
jgi:hypothetical protein